MPKTVLISLAAVVALIVIVILLGMRYLRADDEDDFDDDVPAQRGHSRGRGGHYPQPAAQPGAKPLAQDRARSRRQQDNVPDERLALRPRAMPQVMGRGVGARSAGRAADRVPDDRGWREESGQGAGRGPLPRRDSRSARSGGRRQHDDSSEPAAASARRGYGGPDRAGRHGKVDEFDGRAGRPPSSARDYERDRDDGRDDRDRWEGRDGRDRRDARTAAGTRDTVGSDRDERDRRPVSRSAPRQDGGRKNGTAGDRDELLPAIKPRQGRSKRDADGDWPSNEWDELSDVDYWAELAADRPLNATLPAEQQRRQDRSGSRTDASVPGARSDRDRARPGREARQRDAALQPDQALVPVTGRKIDQAPADGNDDLMRSGSRRATLGRTEQLHAVPQGPGFGRDGLPARHGMRADDDPLTSPSFPRIAADDSRSYGRARRAAADESHPSGPAPAGRVLDGSTQPHSYPAPAAHVAQPAANGADYLGVGAEYARPAADPYGSLPTSSTVPSYPIPAADGAGGYQGSAAGYPMPASPMPASYSGTGRYPAPADPGQSGYQVPGGSSPGSYLPAAAAGPGGYGGESVVRGSYQPPAQDPASFGPLGPDSGGYHSPLSGFSGDGLGDYAPAAATASYAYPADMADYRADRADLPGGYPQPAAQPSAPYADPGSVSAPHPQPDSSYLGGAYGGHESGFHSSLPARSEAGYPVYPAPVAVGHSSPYPAAAGQLPGRSPGYQDPYQQAPYDQAGYQPPAPQPGYAGADPYAADPYGYSGYGEGR